jgi:competence protein ComEA
MPTPAERKALLFLAGVIVLGASVRVVRAARDDGSSDAASRQALSRQLAAVDSARGKESGNRKGPSGRRQRGRMSVRPDSGRAKDSTSASTRTLSLALRRDATPRSRRDTSSHPVLPVDLDVANEADIERLPRIGPVLAHRIVEDRAANGPFGSIEGFERVRGVGPSLAATLRDRVTFSGSARPSNAIVDQRLRSIPKSSKSRHRERQRS